MSPRVPPPGQRAGGVVLTAFLVTGSASVLLGPLIPELRDSWGVSSARVGPLFVAQFTASSIGAVIASLHFRRSLIAGYALIAAGLAGLASGRWHLAVPAIAIMGFGLGLAIVASNLWTAHRDPEWRAARLSTLNLMWGLGAVGSPLLFAAALGNLRVNIVLILLSTLSGLSCIALWLELPRNTIRSAEPPSRRPPRPRARSLFVMALMFFVYVGAETSVGGWLITLNDELTGSRSLSSLWIGSGFWAAILIGRAGAPAVLRHLSEPALYWSCLALAIAGHLLLVLSSSPSAVSIGALVTGLGMAPLFPLTVSVLAAATASTGSRQTGWVLAFGGLGGAALPWLAGRLTVAASAPGLGFLIPLGALIALAVLYGARDVLAPA